MQLAAIDCIGHRFCSPRWPGSPTCRSAGWWPRFGAAWSVSEMVASQEMVQAKPGVRERAELGLGRGQHRRPARRARGALDGRGRAHGRGQRARGSSTSTWAARPRRSTNGWSGSALMRDLDHALRLIEAVVGAVRVPVTLKTRLGWDDDALNAPDLARRAEAAGMRDDHDPRPHPLPVLQGRADWAAIRRGQAGRLDPGHRQRRHRSAPAPRARRCAPSGADGVMIGRGAQGRPWLLAQIAARLSGPPPPRVPRGRGVRRHGGGALRGRCWPSTAASWAPRGPQAPGLVHGRGRRRRRRCAARC